MIAKKSSLYVLMLALLLILSACGTEAATPTVVQSATATTAAPAATATTAAPEATATTAAPEATATTAAAPEATATTAGPEATATTATSAGGATVEIEFWHSLTGAYGTILEQLVKEYNAAGHGVNVTAVYKGNYQDTQKALLAALAANDQPDVMQLEASFSATLAGRDVLKPVGDFIQDPSIGLTAAEYAALYPNLVSAASLNGTLVTMPFNNSMPVLYYNADLLKKLNIAPPETWAEFATACKAVKDKAGGPFGLTINSGNGWVWEAMVWQNGGELFSADYSEVRFNQPAAVEALQFWVDLVKSGCAQLQPWEEGRTAFFNGNAAFYEDSSGGLGGVDDNSSFEVGVTHIPWAAKKVVTIGGANLGIFAGTSAEKQRAAWDFIKFLTSPAAISRQSAATGYLAVTSLALEVDPLKAKLATDPRPGAIQSWLEFAQPRPNVKGYAEISTALKEAFESAMLGQATAQEALDEAADKAAQILK